MNLLAIAVRNVGRNRRRSILSAAAIAVAGMVMVFMFALIEGLKVDLRNNVFEMISGQVRVRTAAFDADEMLNPLHLGISGAGQVVEALAARPEVQALSPRITFPTALYRGGKTYKGMGVAIDPVREEGFQALSRRLSAGRMPSVGAREAAIGVGLARDMGVDVGGKITLFTKNATGGMNGMTLLVTGLLRFSVEVYNTSFFFVPLDTAQRLLGMPDSITEVLLVLRPGEDTVRTADSIAAALRAGGRGELSVKPWTAISVWYTYIRLSDAIFGIFALGFILLGTTVMINTTMMVIYERVREIGTMGALGMTSARIVTLFFLESAIIGLIGSLAGVAAGIAVTLPVSVTGIDYTQTMKGVSLEMTSIYRPLLNMKSTVLAFLYSVGITSLVSIFPSRRASRVEPVKALRAI